MGRSSGQPLAAGGGLDGEALGEVTALAVEVVIDWHLVQIVEVVVTKTVERE